MEAQAQRLDIFDLFNPKEHPRDGTGKFASSWSQKAVGSGVQRQIEAKLSPDSREYMGRVHQAAQARRTAGNRLHSEMVRDPQRENPATIRAIVSVNLANSELSDLLGRSLTQSRGRDLSERPEEPLRSIIRPGTPEDLQRYMGELSNSMGELRRSLGAMPNQWEIAGEKPGAMFVSVGDPNRPGPADMTADITEGLQDTYAFAVQLTGFQVAPFNLSWKGMKESIIGSHYNSEDRRIGLSPGVASSSSMERDFLHEFAHMADEDNPSMGFAGADWLEKRSHDGELKELKGPNHVGYEDAFVDSYVGRAYPAPIGYDPNDPDADLNAILDLDFDTHLEQIQKRGVGTTELLSVGLEYFATPGGMAKLYSVDPDHFNFVVGQILNAKRGRGSRQRKDAFWDENKRSRDKQGQFSSKNSRAMKYSPEVHALITTGEHFTKRLVTPNEFKAIQYSQAISTAGVRKIRQQALDIRLRNSPPKSADMANLNEISALMQQVISNEKLFPVMQSMLGGLKENYGIPEDEADLLARNAEIRDRSYYAGNPEGDDDDIPAGVREWSHETKDFIQGTLSKFHSEMGVEPGINRISSWSESGTGGSFSPGTIFGDPAHKITLNISDADDERSQQRIRQVMWHENGHAIEENAGLYKTTSQFLYDRSEGLMLSPQEFASLYPGMPGSRASYEGFFVSNYVGVDYGGATEVISVGVEHLASPKNAAILLATDPDHFFLTMGAIAKSRSYQHRKSHREKLNAALDDLDLHDMFDDLDLDLLSDDYRNPEEDPDFKDDQEDSIPDGHPLSTILSRIIHKVDPSAIAPEWSESDILSEGRAVVGFLVEEYREGVIHQDAAPPRLPEEDAIAAYFSQVLHQIEPGLDLGDWQPYDIIGEAEAALDVLIDLHHERSLVGILSQPLVPVVPQEEAGYLEEHWNTAIACARCFAYIPGGGCEVVQGEISPMGGCNLWESLVEAVSRTDDNQAVQKVLDWHGLKLGIQYMPGDRRFERTLTAAYGHVRGTYGQSDDGMALDVWVNLRGAASDRCFKLQQLSQEGEHDEDKYILGVESVEAAQALYTANMPKKLMGVVKECAIGELRPRRGDSSPYKWKESSRERDENGRFAKESSPGNAGGDSTRPQEVAAARVNKRFQTFENDLSPARRTLMDKHQQRFGLSRAESQSLALYCGNDDYMAVNGYLKGERFEAGSVGKDTAKAIADTLSLALKKLPPLGRAVTLYRGESWPIADAEARYKAGEVITNEIFTSTSYDLDQIPGGNVRIEIEAAAGGGGKNVAPFSLFDRKQKEVLFDKGTRYEVLSVEKVSEVSEFDIPTGRDWKNEWSPPSMFKPIFEDGDGENEPILKEYGIEGGSFEEFYRRPWTAKYRPILEDLYGRTALRVKLKEVPQEQSDRADAARDFDESKIKRANDGKFGQKNRLTTYSPDVNRVIKQGEGLAKRLVTPEQWAVVDAARSQSHDLLRTERGMRQRVKSGDKLDLSALAYLQGQTNSGLGRLSRSSDLLSAMNSLQANLSSGYGLTEEESRLLIDSDIADGGTRYGRNVRGARPQNRSLYVDAAKDVHANLLTQSGINVKVTTVDVDATFDRSSMTPKRTGEMSMTLGAKRFEKSETRRQDLLQTEFKRSFYHEAGHSLEFGDKELQDACQHFLINRSLPPNMRGQKIPYGTASDYQKGRQVELEVIKLADAFPEVGYDDDEIYVPGQFISPYVGKIYPMGGNLPNARATEVISMGLEQFTTGHSMRSLLATDPDHFFFTLGAIARNRRIKQRRDTEESDRADGFFNWKEASHERDGKGRFAQKPSAKNRLSYVGDEQLIKQVKVLADEISSVHTLPSIVNPKEQQAMVIVSASPHPLNAAMRGEYAPDRGNEISLWTAPNRVHKGNTFAHEYGHHVDSILNLSKKFRPFSFASFKTNYAVDYLEMFGEALDPTMRRYLRESVESLPTIVRSEETIKEVSGFNPDAAKGMQFQGDSYLAVERIMNRAWNTKALKQLRDAATQGYTEMPDGLRKECDRAYVQYLLDPTEVFARSYTQWISTRGLGDDSPPDNPKSFEAFGEQMVLGSRIYPTTWGHDDFKSIHNGFEDGFTDLGLLKGEGKYR